MSCEAIDNTLCCLADVRKQWELSVSGEYQLEALTVELRYARIHLKWGASLFLQIKHYLQTWLEDVEKRLIQPSRNGRMARELIEETLSSLFQDHSWIQERFHFHCLNYFEGFIQGGGFAYKDVMIDELLIGYLDPLLGNLKYIVYSGDNPNLFHLPKKEIRALFEKLKYLREFLKIAGEKVQSVDNVTPRQDQLLKTSEDLLTRIKLLVENAIYLSYGLWMQPKRLNIAKLLFDLLVKMNHIEPEIKLIYVQFFKVSKAEIPSNLGIDIQALVSMDSLLGNLEEMTKDQDNGSIIPSDTHQLAFLHLELNFLRYFLMDPQVKKYIELEDESFTSVLIQLEPMARKAASLTHSICDGQKKDDTAKEMNFLHSNLLEIVNLLKVKIREIYRTVPEPSRSNFPGTPKLGFLEFFIKNLEELLKHGANSIAYVKNGIVTVQSELALLSSFIGDTIKNPEEDKNILGQIMDAAYEAERVIDLISATPFPSWYYMLWLSDVIEKIKRLNKESTEVCSNRTSKTSILNMEKASIQARPQAYTLAPEEMVGFNDEAERIIDQLMRGPKELDIVSIVGMPGLGKTTLAKKVYKHPSITRYFHVRSWYCISQTYERRDLFLSILGNVTELTEEIKKMNDEDMDEELYKSLKGRRYLVVIDDIWSIKPWVDIHNSFPNDCNGSRILFTSRIREVALQAKPRTTDPHYLRFFSKEESWELLKKKVFRGRNCPPELYAIGEQIAENCKGLPLSVVVIAGILTRMEESEAYWREILESLGKQAVSVSRQCTNVLELSYNHLPDHLKPCFLYLGAFPEDREISAWKLVRLWVAEGLVNKTESKTLEEVAEGYLKDLIARSLVLLAKGKCNGGIKSCRLHDLLHEFSIEKSKDEKVLMRSKELVNPEQYRHCFYCKEDCLNEWMPEDPYVRSMMFFPTETSSLYSIDLSVLPYMLKLLRVLDLERIRTLGCTFPIEIVLLVHLRYLAIRGPISHVPSSIGNLWRLETFLFYGTRGEVNLPETLFKMAALKRLHVNTRAAFVLPPTFQPEKSFMSSIQKISKPAFCHGDDTTEKAIRSLKSLHKLKCIFLESWDSNRNCNQLPVLDSLTELESLNATYYGMVKLPCELSLPSNLKKLTLSKFRLPWSEISKIGRLPQLEVLKLFFRAFEGPTWDVNDDEFLKLKVLKLESLNIAEWYASTDAFPCLEQLLLQGCKKLEEVPSGFGYLTTLEMIEVRWCSYSSTTSVCKIRDEQEDWKPDGFKALIQPPEWDSALAS